MVNCKTPLSWRVAANGADAILGVCHFLPFVKRDVESGPQVPSLLREVRFLLVRPSGGRVARLASRLLPALASWVVVEIVERLDFAALGAGL